MFRSLRRVKTADGVEDDAKVEAEDDTKGDAKGEAENDGPCTYECIDWPFSNCKVTASKW